MQQLLLVSFVVLNLVYLQGKTFSYPQPDEENYYPFATLYPEIAKKIGEEPIEILDVVKSIVVYDSDDTTPLPTEAAQPEELDSERINATIPGEDFKRLMKK